MFWSQHKKRILENLDETLQGRFDIGITRYRNSHDGEYGRCWLSFDGEQLVSWSCFEAHSDSPLTAQEATDYFGGTFTHTQFDELNTSKGYYTVDSFVWSLNTYLDGRPHDFLRSCNPVQQALAVCDRRVGKLKLQALLHHDDLPPFVTHILKYRQGAKRKQSNALDH